MTTKRVQITPIQQLVPLPPQAEVTVSADADFMYALISPSDLDENKFTLTQSSSGNASFSNGSKNVLVLKSNSGTPNATISIKPASSQGSQSAQGREVKSAISKKKTVSILIWVGLAVVVLFVLSRRGKKSSIAF